MRQHALEADQLYKLTNDQLYDLLLEFTKKWVFLSEVDPCVDIGKVHVPHTGRDFHIHLGYQRLVKHITLDVLDIDACFNAEEVTTFQMCLVGTTGNNLRIMRAKERVNEPVVYRSLFKIRGPDYDANKAKAGYVACVRLLQLMRFHQLLPEAQ